MSPGALLNAELRSDNKLSNGDYGMACLRTSENLTVSDQWPPSTLLEGRRRWLIRPHFDLCPSTRRDYPHPGSGLISVSSQQHSSVVYLMRSIGTIQSYNMSLLILVPLLLCYGVFLFEKNQYESTRSQVKSKFLLFCFIQISFSVFVMDSGFGKLLIEIVVAL